MPERSDWLLKVEISSAIHWFTSRPRATSDALQNGFPVCCSNKRRNDKLSFKDHLLTVLRRVSAKVGALRRLRKLVSADISLMLYKAYILPQLEYCSPLLLGINKTLNKKLESANYYALKALLNFGNNLDYDSILSAVNMQSLEHRRYYQSLVLLFKFIKTKWA